MNDSAQQMRYGVVHILCHDNLTNFPEPTCPFPLSHAFVTILIIFCDALPGTPPPHTHTPERDMILWMTPTYQICVFYLGFFFSVLASVISVLVVITAVAIGVAVWKSM